MTGIPPELQEDADLLMESIGKRIAFNAGKSRLIGELLAFDPRFLKLRIRVTDGREAGLHTTRLGRMSNFAVLESDDGKASTHAKPKKSA